MTHAAHTPGPWQSYNGGALIARIEAVDGAPAIARTEYRPGGESAANARLIAAAPDLLAALEQLQCSRVFSIDHEENRRVGSERYALREMLAAAIAKAKGAQQP